ncbi:MAG: DUF1538 domain-containing protein [Clostridia bacterium]|nr:DUF1538 domain-containing protein [Clostridia bacterium]
MTTRARKKANPLDSLIPERRQTSKRLKEKIRESLSSVLPISLLVLALSLLLVPIELSTMGLFLLGACLLIVGMGLFTLGADMAMLPMGAHIGAFITKKRDLRFLIVVAFFLGTLITMAEPDLTVLANQVQGVPNLALILTVSVGVGLFLVVALLRILFQWKLSFILIGLYAAVFLLGALIKPEFVPMAFDAGGVTTGPMTVPFILSLGMGVANVRGGRSAQDDSFGLVALCSVGPVLAIMLISLFFPHLTNVPEEAAAPAIANTRDLMLTYRRGLPVYGREVLIALAPILILFFAFQIFSLRLPRQEIKRMVVGLLYTYLGLVLFLTGVNVGFLPMGDYLGRQLGGGSLKWLLLPLGMLMGFLVVKAEPAVHVLNEQVEQVTSGAISKAVMLKTLSIGVSVSVGLAMTRVLTGISIWYFLAPGYFIALALTFVTDPIFTAIAFDSGGVASGPMTAAFMLPLFMGACGAMGGNILEDAFGIVAMVAMTPLIAIEALGVVYKLKTRKRRAQPVPAPAIADSDDEIIDV